MSDEIDLCIAHTKTDYQNPKAVCVCQDGGAYHGWGGIVRQHREGGPLHIEIACWITEFTFPAEEIYSVRRCNTFEVLGK